MNKIKNSKYLIIRRIVQLSILFLFVGANIWGWKILTGNLSTAKVLDTFYLADPYAIIQMFAAGSIVGIDAIIGAVITLLFYSLIGGRAFCSFVCPINIVTDTAAWARKLLLKKSDVNILNISRKTRYYILAISLIVSAITGVAAFEFISPISILHRGIIFGIGTGWIVILFVFLFDLLILERAWCGHLCPLGAFYSLVGKFNFIKVKHKVENCTKCMKCFDVCPEKQVLSIVTKQSGQIKSGACTACGRCIDVCDDDSLKFSFNNYKKN